MTQRVSGYHRTVTGTHCTRAAVTPWPLHTALMFLLLALMSFQVFRFVNKGPFSTLQNWECFVKSFLHIWLLEKKLFSSQTLQGSHIKLEMSGRNHTQFITPCAALYCDWCQLSICQHLD